jgi:hypothetical protein
MLITPRGDVNVYLWCPLTYLADEESTSLIFDARGPWTWYIDTVFCWPFAPDVLAVWAAADAPGISAAAPSAPAAPAAPAIPSR